VKHPVLYGEYDLTIDEKCRLSIPAEVRRAINPQVHGEALFIVVGVNRKPWIYVERYYETLATEGPQEIVPGMDMLDFDQLHFALAGKLEIDKSGRVLISDKTLKRLGIGRDVTMIGVRDHLELWNRMNGTLIEKPSKSEALKSRRQDKNFDRRR